MRRITGLPLVLSILLLSSISSAQPTSTTAVPNLIRYGGTLKDVQGAALSSSNAVGVTFAIYKQQDGGAPVWMETQNVTPDANGQYTVILGSTTATGLPSDLFSQEEQRWLGVQVQGEGEQARVLLVSVPYAFKAHEAETLGGLPASAFVKAPPTDTSSDGSSAAALNALSSAGGAGGTSTTNGKTTAGKPKTFAPCSTIGGAGTLNFIPLWTPDGCTLGNSLMSQSTAGRVDVNGNFNLASTPGGYQIGSNTVLSIGSPTDDNLFLGAGAGAHNTAGRGQANTFSGYNAGANNTTGAANMFSGAGAGLSNTTGGENTFSGAWAGVYNTSGQKNTFSGWRAGYRNHTGDYNTFVGVQAGTSNTSGSDNTFSGYQAGYSNTTGVHNTFTGYQAGYSNTVVHGNTFSGYQAGYSNTIGYLNTFVGFQAGYSNTGGLSNTFLGDGAGYSNTSNDNTFLGYIAGTSNTTGYSNTFVGKEAGIGNTTGSFNTFVGSYAGNNSTTGGSNTFLGTDAGSDNTNGVSNTFLGSEAGSNNTTGSSDVYVANHSCPYPCSESNTIRIGTQGTGNGQQNVTYIAGIYGSTAASGIPVYINANGQLGTQTSSLRFKEQVHDMGESSSKLFQLRPVTFFYRPQYDDGSHAMQYGLIAEEVAEVYPDMVAYDKDGQPYTVKYQCLAPMLLNELQKQHAVVAAQQDVIKEMQERLSRLETLVSAQVKIAEGAAASAGTR